jgi:serine/threonine protein kinase
LAREDWLVDAVVFGRYQLIELIGEGGMGKVYKAHDTVMGRDVAIKVLPRELATNPGYEQRFRREASVAARLTEPHIIPIFEAGEIDGQLYLVMPIISGVDVHTVLHRDGPMSPQRAVQVVEQLAAALNGPTNTGLVHRDIKPSNALLTGDDFVYLIDFGIAHDTAATRLTSTGMTVGTLAYMAPERFTAGTADARADVYSLTCVLHECLTGTTPYPGNSIEQQLAGHLKLEPPKPASTDSRLALDSTRLLLSGWPKTLTSAIRALVSWPPRLVLPSARLPHLLVIRIPARPRWLTERCLPALTMRCQLCLHVGSSRPGSSPPTSSSPRPSSGRIRLSRLAATVAACAGW